MSTSAAVMHATRRTGLAGLPELAYAATPALLDRDTLVDGVADSDDVSATLRDLAVRGWFRIVAVAEPADAPDGRPRDWELRRADPGPSETPTAFESLLLDRLFEGRDRVRLSALKGSFGVTMREAQIGLYREVVDRGVVLPASAGPQRSPPGGGAEGIALRIEALGFREYLATVEAGRLRFEEKRALLSSYLPYAVAFGLTAHFADLLRQLAKDRPHGIRHRPCGPRPGTRSRAPRHVWKDWAHD